MRRKANSYQSKYYQLRVVRPILLGTPAVFALWLSMLVMGVLHASGSVVISEIQYEPVGTSSNEFVELYNTGSNVVALAGWHFADGISYVFPQSSVLGPGAYLVVAASQTAFTSRYPGVSNLAPGAFTGQLSNQGERLALADAASNIVFDVTYNNTPPWPAAAEGLGSSLVLRDPLASPNDASNWRASAELHGSPGSAGGFFVRDVVINEVLAHTDPPQEDAVELRNLTTNPVSVAGWFLSDDNVVRKKYRFPPGSVVPASAYLVIYQDDMLGTNSLIPFSISSKGDDVYLSEADASGNITRFVDQVDFDPTANGVAFGRTPDGSDTLVLLATPTFGVPAPTSVPNFRSGTGARNALPWVGPVVINEIMYHPPDSNTLGRMAVEYIELLNTSGNPVPLYNPDHTDFAWRLSGGISYTFPSNTVLNAGQFLLVVATNDVEAFRLDWGISTNVLIVGPFSNSLNNAGDTVSLRAANNPEPPENIAAYHFEDQIKYNDRLPWPLAADGLGGSLERNNPLTYGNTAANWHSILSGGTPGTTNSVFVPPGAIIISEIMAVNRSTLNDEDGDSSDWIELYNTTDQPVSLAGWHLTDQPSNPTLWTFPNVTIGAHGYVIVFASLKNRTNAVSELHTNFSLDEAGEYLALLRDDLVVEFAFDPAFPPQAADIGYGVEAIGSVVGTVIRNGSLGRYLVPTNALALSSNWTARVFDDSAWAIAGNAIGYDVEFDYLPLIQTDLRTQMYEIRTSAFVRYPFTLADSAIVESMLLRIKYEDGFAAWLNGVRVASGNAAATLAWNSASTASRGDALAVVFEDIDLTSVKHLLVDGANMLALQSLNTLSTSSDLLLLPELQILWPGQTTGVSFVAGYLSPASPGSGNGVGLPGFTTLPVLSDPGGVFTGSLSVTVTCANAQADIRYTLDGSVPTTNSLAYSSPLTITNEVELVVRAFVSGWVPSPVVGAVYRTAFLGINEILAKNATATPDIADFSAFPDWIELYNASTSPIDLSGYYLSDKLDQPTRWRIPNGAIIPAQGYLHVWTDGFDSLPGLSMTRPFWPFHNFTTQSYHTSFKLAATGEAIGFYSPTGSHVDSVTYGAQTVDVSYGRHPDGSANWAYFGEPTAGSSNRAPAVAHNLFYAPAVIIAPTNDALIYTGSVQVVLSSEPAASEIRYTLDGSTPTSVSLLYTQALNFVSSTVIRARAYESGLLPSKVATRTFLIGVPTPDLPIISLVIDPFLLDDPLRGIFERTLKQREVPGNIQLYATPTNMEFQIDAGFRLFSYNTFLAAQKPLTVFLDGDYGFDELAYQLFPDKALGFFDRFVLRNGNDDWNNTFLRDTLGQQMLHGAINNAVQAFRPCAIYLNGGYYGMINIQEKMDEMYCANNYGIPLDDIDFYENEGIGSGDQLDAGTVDAWEGLLAYIGANSMANPVHYEYVKSQVDIEDLVDYVAGQVFVVDTSWNHNRKWWRERKPGGRWRWCFVDLDRALGSGSIGANQINSMGSSQEVYRELLSNVEFHAYAAQRLMAHFNSSFSPERIIPIIDSEASRIRNEYIQYAARFGLSSVGTWDSRIESIRNYARNRPANAMANIAAYFGGGQTAQLQLDVVGGTGQVLANYVSLNTVSNPVFVADLPVKLDARPDIGQTFLYWEISGQNSERLEVLPSGSVWRYNDAVTNDIPGWSDPSFNDSAWSAGAAQLGYGDGDEVTVLGFGGNAGDKLRATYFRSEIVVTALASFDSLELDLMRDDGAVVYIGGREVLRSNMPGGLIDRTTQASSAVAVPAESQFFTTTLSPTNFVEGTNAIAVEVHQFAGNSSDLSFDLGLTGTRLLVGSTQTNYNANITIQPTAGMRIKAVFAPSGQSVLSGSVQSNLTLTAAQSPYLASGDIYVPPNVSLTVEAGTTILMPEGASFYVQGELAMLGTTNAPVRVELNPDVNARRVITDTNLSNRAETRWGCISFDQATHTGRLVNVVLRGASVAGHDPSNMKAAISARDSDLWMDGLDVEDVLLPIFVQDGKSVTLQNSRFLFLRTGDVVNFKRTISARVENCVMIGGLAVDADAIDYDGINGGIIRGNTLIDFLGDNNDAIDVGEGTQDLTIDSNFVARVADKAISIGQGSTAVIRHNVIRDCTMGIGIKDTGSFGFIDHNTFHQNGRAIAVFEKNRGAGGGGADVRNSILSNTVGVPIDVDSVSTALVAYCLSDTGPLDGIGNREAGPQFENAKQDNFRLQTGSLAIDNGSPLNALDPDGSRTDMGAFPFDWREGHAVITEIHYHPALSNASEFIELYNAGGTALDLEGWQFSKGLGFVFPASTVLAPGAYLILAQDTNGLSASSSLMAWTTGVLNNAGETIQLIDSVSNEIDEVTYSPLAPWPLAPDGLGPSLSLIHPRMDNRLAESWYDSASASGTPGATFDNAMPGPTFARFETNGAIRIEVGGVPGLFYDLEFTESLMPPNWQPVELGREAVGGQIIFMDSPVATNGFYRIRFLP
jgi:hypothetical protein